MAAGWLAKAKAAGIKYKAANLSSTKASAWRHGKAWHQQLKMAASLKAIMRSWRGEIGENSVAAA